MKIPSILLSVSFVFLFLLGSPSDANAQGFFCNVGLNCTDDTQCQTITGGTFFPPGGCPTCIACDLDSASPTFQTCQPLDALCDDGSPCTNDACVFDVPIGGGNGPIEPNGCKYESLAVDFPPPDDLPIECYICEPTVNDVFVDNGICEPEAGETCANSSDCEEVGVTCGTPPPPPFNCFPNSQNPDPVCQDGDRCTDDLCEPVIAEVGVTPQGEPGTCTNPQKSCSAVSDGCCPAGCDGPDPATTTSICLDDAGAPIDNCDADCCFPQVCGDALVEPDETCDDEADAGDSGISPTGAIVSDSQCRDPGEVAECTYCGDGILQEDAGEQCELGLIGSCGTSAGAGTCDLSTCQCVQNLCVSGSGNIWDEIRPGCANCSLNSEAVSYGWVRDYQAFLILFGLVGMALVWRRSRS